MNQNIADIIMSKNTYKTEETAVRFGKKKRGTGFAGTVKLPSGRFCYLFAVYFCQS